MPQHETFRYFNNIGGINLLSNEVNIDSPYAEEINNLHATSSGSWTSQNVGYVHLNAAAVEGGATITSLYPYTDLNGITHLLASVAGSLYTVNTGDGTFTSIGTGFAQDAPFSFTTFKGLMIACNGSDPPQKWDGSSPISALSGWTPTIAGVSPGNPSIIETFANRLVFCGDNANPSMVFISALEDPQNFTPTTGAESAGAIQVSPGDGQRITGLKTLYLPVDNEEVLVIFKERSTYLLIGQDANTFTLQKLSSEFGAVSPNSVVSLGNQLLFLSTEGITSLSTATAQGNLTTGFVSNLIRPQIQMLNQSRLNTSFAVHLRHRQEVWWFVPDGSATQNQRVLIMNYGLTNNAYAWSRRSGIVAACGTVMNGNLYTGSYTGFLQEQLQGNSYNGSPIPWTYRTPYYPLGNPRLRKRVRDLEIYLKQLAGQTLALKMVWDLRRGSGQKEIRNLTVTPDSASTLYGSAIFGQDAYNVSGMSILKIVPSGSGRFFQLELSGQTTTNAVELQGWTITAQTGGYR